MKIKLGIIGLGVVGEAIKIGMEGLGHQVLVHDLKLDTKIEDLSHTDVCFICVPTPAKNTNECDISILESVLKELEEINYAGIIAIKSTVPPETTSAFQEKYKNEKICFVPEFLRERCASEDFIENHDLCVIGTESKEIYEVIKLIHGHYPKKFVRLSPVEAEIVKYLNNIYAATLVTLANNFYDVCKFSGADYSKVKDAFVQRDHVHDSYLNSSEDLRGYSGPCLPKDVRGMSFYVNQGKIDAGIFEFLDTENSKYKKTVLEGMREE